MIKCMPTLKTMSFFLKKFKKHPRLVDEPFHNIAKLGNALFVDMRYLNIMGPKSKINIVSQI